MQSPKIMFVRLTYLTASVLVFSIAGVLLLRCRGRLQGAQSYIPGEACCYL